MKLTVDLIVVAERNILLIKRKKFPFQDKLVLPGGHVEADDASLAHACAREAAEEIGLLAKPEDLKLLTILDTPDRDPRPGRRISIVFFLELSSKLLLQNCVPGSDALEISILPFEQIKEEEIGFDHFKAIKSIIKKPC